MKMAPPDDEPWGRFATIEAGGITWVRITFPVPDSDTVRRIADALDEYGLHASADNLLGLLK